MSIRSSAQQAVRYAQGTNSERQQMREDALLSMRTATVRRDADLAHTWEEWLTWYEEWEEQHGSMANS